MPRPTPVEISKGKGLGQECHRVSPVMEDGVWRLRFLESCGMFYMLLIFYANIHIHN